MTPRPQRTSFLRTTGEEFSLPETGRWFPSFGEDLTYTLTVAGIGEAHFGCVEAC
mgnify:CR=1 FL=1